MISMREENLRERKKQRRACVRRLRMLLVLFSIFLIAYMVFSYFLLKLMLEDVHIAFLRNFLFHSVALLVWLAVIRMLWSCRRLGRLLFQVLSLANLYTLYELPALFRIDIAKENYLLRIVFALMVAGKTALALYMSWSLQRNPQIIYIWKPHSTAADNEMQEEAMNTVNFSQKEHIQHDHRLDIRARNRIRACSVALLLYQYGMLVLLYLLMFVFRYYSSDHEGMQFMQRTLLLASLFSALIWSLPAVSLFLYKPWSRWIIPVMWGMELLRLLFTLPQLADVFQTQNYQLLSWGILIVTELLRYLLLYRLLQYFLKDPFVRVYWMRRYHEGIQEDQEL